MLGSVPVGKRDKDEEIEIREEKKIKQTDTKRRELCEELDVLLGEREKNKCV